MRHSDRTQPSARSGTRARVIATAATLLAHLLLLLILLYTFLTYPRPGMEEPQPLQPNPVTFVEPETVDYEFDPAVIDRIMAGEQTEEQTEETYGGDIPDAVDAGDVNQTAMPVAAKEESPVKVTDKPAADQAVAKDIKNRTGNAFGKRTKGDPTKAKDDSRTLTRAIANSPAAKSDKVGKIVFQVNVNGEGKVSGKPTLLRAQCEGEAAQDDGIIARCRTEAARQTFSVVIGSGTQLGTVVFTFTDKR